MVIIVMAGTAGGTAVTITAGVDTTAIMTVVDTVAGVIRTVAGSGPAETLYRAKSNYCGQAKAMFSTVPKLADKAFIVGFLFPVIMFIAFIGFLFDDILIYTEIYAGLLEKGDLKVIVYITMVVWGTSMVMSLLNHELIQILEGYVWPFSEILWAFSQEKRRYENNFGRFSELRQQWKEAISGDKPFPQELQDEHDAILRYLTRNFPSKKHLLLPTRFGNSIRAFEDYSRFVYGADAVPLWIHLNSVIPNDFRTAVENAQSHVNFFVNTFYLSTIAAIISGIRFGYEGLSAKGIFFGVLAALSGIVAWMSYELSIRKTQSWGSIVRAAFDCYLPALAKQLGYNLPRAGVEQFRFWEAVSQRAIYQEPLTAEEWPRDNAMQIPDSPNVVSSDSTASAERSAEH